MRDYKRHNDYYIKDNVAYISLTQGQTVMIDKHNLLMVSDLRWHAYKHHSGKFCATHINNKSGKRVLLPRYMLRLSRSDKIEYLDGNTLNCKEDNLRIYKNGEERQKTNRIICIKNDIVSLDVGNDYVCLIDLCVLNQVMVFKWYSFKKKSSYYVATNMKNKNRRFRQTIHRFLMNANDGQHVDHINGDPMDNRICNLRFCTNAQNSMNSKKTNRNTSSIFKGVYWDNIRNRWVSIIKNDGKTKFLGQYKNEEDAARAYDAAAIKYFGRFARTNEMMGLYNETVRE